MKKRVYSIILNIAIIASLLAMTVPAAQAVTIGSGTVGNLAWTVDIPTGETRGTLTISRRSGYTGNVSISNYSASSRPPWYPHSAQVDRVIIEAGVTGIGSYAFADFGNITEAVVAGNVTSIGNDAFRGCGNLIDFHSAPGVTAPHTFGGLTAIGANAFYNCYSLRSIYIPVVSSVGADAFVGCRNLNSIIAGTTGKIRMSGGVLVEMNTALTQPVRVIKSPVGLTGNTASNEYTIQTGITSIDAEAFAYCLNISSFVIPAGVMTIKDRAFAYNGGLMSAVFMGDAPTSFGTNVFYGTDDNYFKIIFYPQGLRWTAPRWQGYRSEVNNSRLELDRYVIVMEIGAPVQLRATAQPSTASQNVTWSSADEDIATVKGSISVNSIGIIEGVSAGMTTITARATESGAIANCTVIVLDKGTAAAGVLLDQSRISVSIDANPLPALTAVVYPYPDENDPDRDEIAKDIARNLVWASSDPGVAVVSTENPESLKREIILVKPGTATITVRTPDGKSTASCVITVEAAAAFVPVTDISLAITTAAMGAAINLNELATLRPANATHNTMVWRIVSDQASLTGASIMAGVLTVPWNQTGSIVVEASVARGRADTEWGYNDNLAFIKTFTINIVPFLPVTGVTDVPSLAFAGVPLQLRGTVLPAGASYRKIEWSTVPDVISGVYLNKETGVLTAQWPGSVTVRATVQNGVIGSQSETAAAFVQDFTIKVDPYVTNTLELRANPGGTASGAGAGQFAGGEIITITAIPNAGYTFAGWYSTNGGAFADAGRAVTQFTMPPNATMVTAYFTYTGLPGGSAGDWTGGVVLPTPVHYFTNNSIYTRNSSVVFGHVTIRDFQLFSYVTLDGKTLSRNAHYTANRSGGGFTEIILANGYLDALEQGAHTLTVYFSDYVSVTAVFTVLWMAQTSQYYDDVYVSDWYSNSVSYVSERGWMSSRPNEPRLFRPSDPVTQGEVIDALYRMAGNPTIMNQYGQALQGRDAAYAWVLANGILPLGGEYNLYSYITRQDIALIFARMVNVLRLRYPVVRSAPSFADDWQIDPNARAAVNDIYRAGIMSGRTTSTFVPLGNLTRAECAAILHRFSEAVGR